MEIIVEGKKPDYETEIFKCQTCGCIFKEDIDECEYVPRDKAYDCECPCCKTDVRTKPGENKLEERYVLHVRVRESHWLEEFTDHQSALARAMDIRSTCQCAILIEEKFILNGELIRVIKNAF